MAAASPAAPNAVKRTVGAEIPATDPKSLCVIAAINHPLGFQRLNGGMEIPLQQHPRFAAALRSLGTDVRCIDIDGAAPVQMIRRFGVAFASRGPLWRTEDPDALRRSALRLVNAERPSAIYRRAGFRQLMTPAHVAELDLRDTDWVQRANGKWRNAWRKSLKSGLVFQQAPFEAARHNWVLIEDRNQQRRKKFRALPHGLIHAYAAQNPDHVTVYSAQRKKETIAVMLFLLHGQVVTYHLGWTSAAGRATNAHYGLLMKAAEDFHAKGITRLDLGSVDTERAPGLARFKIGSGAQVRPLGGTWLRVPL